VTVQRFLQSPWTLLGSVAFVLGVTLAACGGDEAEGTTPKCPELSLYDLRSLDAAGLQQQIQERQAAELEGCVTAPGDAGTNVAD
jgi:hypothetical protein